MAKPLDSKIAEVLKAYGFGPESCWDCHGTWVVYHKALERIAAKAGIEFDMPQVLEGRGGEKIVAICVRGVLKGRSEWSIGEAAPGNNKNSYPWAMAEKRAKDRVILKLIGLHGLAYSEEEADDFKNSKPEWQGPLNKTNLTKKMREFHSELVGVTDSEELEGLLAGYKAELQQCQEDLPGWWYQTEDSIGAEESIANKRRELEGEG